MKCTNCKREFTLTMVEGWLVSPNIHAPGVPACSNECRDVLLEKRPQSVTKRAFAPPQIT